MKKILTITLLLLSLTLMAQVPQGVGYQGVATVEWLLKPFNEKFINTRLVFPNLLTSFSILVVTNNRNNIITNEKTLRKDLRKFKKI